MTDQQVRDWVSSFDTVLTDCDGVLWVGADPVPGSPELVQRMRQLGKRVFYVTNNSTKHRREYKTKVDKLGFGGNLDDIIGTAYLAAAYVVGSSGITQELDDVGIKYLPIGPEPVSDTLTLETIKLAPVPIDPRVGAVVVGFDIHISFAKILKGASYANLPGALFVATNTDEQFPMKGTDQIVPGVPPLTSNQLPSHRVPPPQARAPWSPPSAPPPAGSLSSSASPASSCLRLSSGGSRASSPPGP